MDQSNKINGEAKMWKPSGESIIFNLHYTGFVNLSRNTPNRMHRYSARSSSSTPVRQTLRVYCNGPLRRRLEKRENSHSVIQEIWIQQMKYARVY